MSDALAALQQMATSPDAASEHYPGSKRRRRAVTPPVDPWADQPGVDLLLRGETVRFYPVGVLATMLGRKPAALRKWERLGYLPQSPYRSPGRTPEGQRRLYTRAQIEGLVAIARSEGLLDGPPWRAVASTKFPQRAVELFKETA